jgi:acyl carrier protein
VRSEAEIRKALREWIVTRAQASPGRELQDDTPILAPGLLSSLDVVELILFIESLRGEEVEVERIEPEALTDVNTLYDTFFRASGA